MSSNMKTYDGDDATYFQKIIRRIEDEIGSDCLRLVLEYSDSVDYYFNKIVRCKGKSRGKMCTNLVLGPPSYRKVHCSNCLSCEYCSRIRGPFSNPSRITTNGLFICNVCKRYNSRYNSRYGNRRYRYP